MPRGGVSPERAGEDLPCCAPQLSHRLPTMSPSPVKMIKKKELVLNSVAEFLGIWAARGEASLSLSTKDGVTTIAFSHTLSGHPDDPLLPPPAPTGRNRRQRGPARKERDRMRAARYQAAKDSASQARPQGSTIQCDQCDKSFKTESGLKIHAGKSHKPIATVTSSTSAAASATGNSLRILTSPSPESGRRRIMSCAGRVERTPSFSNLDGATPSPLLPSSNSQSGSSSTTTSDCDENEEEENIIDIGNCDFDKIAPFCSVYSTPPEKVKSSDPELGIGTFYEIDKSSGHYVYQFQNGRLFEI